MLLAVLAMPISGRVGGRAAVPSISTLAAGQSEDGHSPWQPMWNTGLPSTQNEYWHLALGPPTPDDDGQRVWGGGTGKEGTTLAWAGRNDPASRRHII